MINYSTTRGEYILKATVPASTEHIDYEVYIWGTVGGVVTAEELVFVGQSRYFGGDYEIDCEDWVDTFLSDNLDVNSIVTGCYIKIILTYTSDLGVQSSQTLTRLFYPKQVDVDVPTFDACGGAELILYNSWFYNDSTDKLMKVKLLTKGFRLVGRVDNIMHKTTYMDKYGDVHNGSTSNKYELECYIDPEWLNMKDSGDTYGAVMAALQSSKKTIFRGVHTLFILGMGIYGVGDMEGRVKDVEKVEVYSTYSVRQKLPTLKITFEVYR